MFEWMGYGHIICECLFDFHFHFGGTTKHMYAWIYVIVRIKRRNDEVTQMKLALSLNKDLHVRAAQEKAAEDREERIRKVNMSRLG